MIAVTCRNGEHFTLDPDSIERVEDHGDVVVVLGDGTHYVIGEDFDELLRRARDHRSAAVSARRMLSGPTIAPRHVPSATGRDAAGLDALVAAVRGTAEV